MDSSNAHRGETPTKETGLYPPMMPLPLVGVMPLMPPGVMPPFLPPMPFPGMPPSKKKKLLDAPKEFPKEGEGFPFPNGGWAYGVSIGKPYEYIKTDEYAQHMAQADKRTAIQLAFVYLVELDSKINQFMQDLSGEELIVLHGNDDLDVNDSFVHQLFTYNNIKHTSKRITQLDISILDASKQMLILADTLSVTELADSISEALTSFVTSGGLLISLNNAITVLSLLFPDKLKPKLGMTTLDKPIEIGCKLTAPDTHIFAHYAAEAKAGKQLVRLHGMQRFEVVESGNTVKVLITETAPQAGQPLAVKFSVGKGRSKKGTVYHLLTLSNVVSKVGSQGGTSFQPLADILPNLSKELAIKQIELLRKQNNPPQATITAWRAALSCGYPTSVNIALSYFPALHSFFSLLLQHQK